MNTQIPNEVTAKIFKVISDETHAVFSTGVNLYDAVKSAKAAKPPKGKQFETQGVIIVSNSPHMGRNGLVAFVDHAGNVRPVQETDERFKTTVEIFN